MSHSPTNVEYGRSARFERISIEPFFNDDNIEAVRSQVQWFQHAFRVSDDFFVELLNIERREFTDWEKENGFLSKDKQDLLREFWQMTLHLMSFYDYDMVRLRELFQYQTERASSQSQFAPPWAGSSLRNYLAKTGPRSIREVGLWIQALRYANWY